MPEQESDTALAPLPVQTRRPVWFFGLIPRVSKGDSTLGLDYLVVREGRRLIHMPVQHISEAACESVGLFDYELKLKHEGVWRSTFLPFGVALGLPFRDILGKRMFDWGLTQAVSGWKTKNSCELFPEQFKLAKWANLPHGVIISLGGLIMLAGITLVFSGQQNLGAILTFGPMPVILFIYLYAYETFSCRVVVSRDNLIIFPHKATRLEFKISQIEKLEVEVDSRSKRSGKKRLTLCLKDGERIPLCTFRREWQTAEESLLDALRSRDVAIVVSGYE